MLHVIARLEDQAYAVPAARLLEILPLVRLRRTAGRDHLATFRHRGRLAPAIDLSRLLLGRSFEARISTRILVAPVGDEVVGVVAENVTETRGIAHDAWQAVRRTGEPPHLGPAALTASGAVRRLELDALLEAAFGEAARAV